VVWPRGEPDTNPLQGLWTGLLKLTPTSFRLHSLTGRSSKKSLCESKGPLVPIQLCSGHLSSWRSGRLCFTPHRNECAAAVIFCFSVWLPSTELITQRAMPAVVRNIPATASAEKQGGGGTVCLSRGGNQNLSDVLACQWSEVIYLWVTYVSLRTPPPVTFRWTACRGRWERWPQGRRAIALQKRSSENWRWYSASRWIRKPGVSDNMMQIKNDPKSFNMFQNY